MSKSTTLDELETRWLAQKLCQAKRCKASAGKHWEWAFKAHNTKLLKCKRLINRASRIGFYLQSRQDWTQIIRSNRAQTGLPPVVTRFGNSGTPRIAAQGEQQS